MCYSTQSEKEKSSCRLPKKHTACNMRPGPPSPEPPESEQNSEDPEELLNVKFHRLATTCVPALEILLNNFSYLYYYFYKPGCRNEIKTSEEVLKHWTPHSRSQASRYLDDRLSPMKTSLSARTGRSWGPEASDPAGNGERAQTVLWASELRERTVHPTPEFKHHIFNTTHKEP